MNDLVRLSTRPVRHVPEHTSSKHGGTQGQIMPAPTAPQLHVIVSAKPASASFRRHTILKVMSFRTTNRTRDMNVYASSVTGGNFHLNGFHLG